VRYYRDTYAEHPEDRKNIEYSVHLDNDADLVTLRYIKHGYFKKGSLTRLKCYEAGLRSCEGAKYYISSAGTVCTTSLVKT
jgi:hypothetical protein